MNHPSNETALNATRSPSQPSITYALLAIFGLALGLRVWGVSFGLPYDFTADEVHEIVRALKLGAGEYTWGSGKGGLYYFLFVEYGLLFVTWWMIGWISGPTEFAISYLQDPSPFYLAGRLTVAMMGALTCLVVYGIARRIYDQRVGLGAAFIGATAYYHAMWSHYINVDTGMTLALWGAILAYLTYESSGRLRWLIGAGALAGIATAFKLPGVVALPILLLAIATPLEKWKDPRRLFREACTVTLAMALALTIVAPETTLALAYVGNSFSGVLGAEDTVQEISNSLRDDINAVTIYRGMGYFTILLLEHNVVLTVAAFAGAIIGCWRRQRWDIIWASFIGAFLVVMTLADRPGTERYLFPILPAIWLLGSNAVAAIARHRRPAFAAGLAAIAALPLFALIKQNYMWTRPDTRVLAKEWIEANVPPGSRILMDGMRYRFIHSPPLNPDEATVARRVADASVEGGRLSRGISGQTLDLYAAAMARVEGPRYELHSTVWGLEVQELSYYQELCFDYIITSSDISHRFVQPHDQARYPMSAQFYLQLPQDSRFALVYTAEPVAWRVQGPTIAVYEVSPLPSCREGVSAQLE